MAALIAAGVLAASSLVKGFGGKTRKVVIDQSIKKSAPSRVQSFFDTQNQLGNMMVNTQPERNLPDFTALDDLLQASSRNSLAQNDAFEKETAPGRFAARKNFENTMENYAATPDQTQKDLMRMGLWSGAAAGGTPQAGSVGQSAARAVYGRGADAENARRLQVTGNYLANNPQVEVTASPRSKASAVAGFQAQGTDLRNARSAAMLDAAQDQAGQQFSFGEQVLAQLIAEAKGTANAQTQVSSLKADARDRKVGGVTDAIGAFAGGDAGSQFGKWLGGLFGNTTAPTGGTPGFNPQGNIIPASNFGTGPYGNFTGNPGFLSYGARYNQ